MDNKTLVALKESIKNWERQVRDEGFDPGDCPLCALDKKQGRGDCESCIIKERTGLGQCHDTPFWNKTGVPFPIYEQNEIAFLKSLLPKEKEESKMKFVIKNDKQKNKNVEVELSLKSGSLSPYGDVEVYSGSKVLIAFKGGKFIRPTNARLNGIETDSNGRILEIEGD